MKPAAVKLSWLAGVIEGEGSITANLIRKTPKPNFKGSYGGIATGVSMSNTEKDMCDETQSIFREILDGDYARVHTNTRRTVTNRIAYRTGVSGHPQVKKVLTAILPYMKTKSKRRQAELVLKICNRKKYSRVSNEELNIIADLRFLHGGHNLTVETIRQRVFQKRTQDIVRTTTKVAEIDRNINPPPQVVN
jgi:hypothetical protein